MRSARSAVLSTLLLFAATAGAQDATIGPRPRVGLVLSGGGARGAADIGVLEMLDELRVPVDAIAGTSMGAVVGGLYASGMSGAEIERAMASVDWQAAFRDRPPRTALDYRRKEEDREFLVNVPLGLQGRRLVIPKGLVQGQVLTETLRQLTLPVALITDFDRLPTPFRAIATDLASGGKRVLASGDLTGAMRASMSVPGLFEPVEYQGELLVDGGLADYLPIDVARAMGVDILVVVDAGYPLQPRKNLNTLPGITNQMLSILLRKDIERDLATLGPNDIVVRPQLGEFSSYNFPETMRVVAAGTSAARAVQPQLAALSLSEEDYARYQQARAAVRAGLPQVQFLTVEPASGQYQRPIQDMFSQFVGQTLDPDALNAEVGSLYGRGSLEALDYRLAQDPLGRAGLDFTARRNSWGPNYLRFGVALEDSFKGQPTFNAAGRLDITELNSLGAESVWDAQVGTSPLLASELYLPLSNVYRYFIAPHARVGSYEIAQTIDGRQIGDFRVSSVDYGIDFGRELGNWGEVRIGAQENHGSTRVELGPSAPPSYFTVTEYFVRFGYDSLTSANFPRSGQAFLMQASVEDGGGGERGTDLMSFDWRAAHSWARNTVVAWISGGGTIGGSQTNVRTFFPLGGFLNLSGVPVDTLAGPQFAIGRLIYLHKVGSGGEGILDVPGYVGSSFEIGNVWASRSEISFADTRKDFSVFFGADTYIGPAYFAVGYDESGTTVFSVFLGRSF